MTPDANMMTTTQSLPNEILTLILSYLDNGREQQTLYQCSFVSKQFHFVANPIIWKEILFDDNKNGIRRFLYTITTASSQRLAILGYHIEYLYLINEIWTDDHLLRLLPHIPRLKYLKLDYDAINITDTSFQQLPFYCQQLTSLDLVRTFLTQVSFSAIGRYCHQLCELDWQLRNSQLPEWLELLTQCPLRSLELYIAHQITYSTTTSTTMAIQSFDQLTSLRILYSASSPTTASLLLHLPTATQPTNLWPRLQSLTLYNYDTMDKSALIKFIQSHPTLEHLDLRGDFPTSDATLDANAVWLEQLGYLSLDSKTTSTISFDGVLRLVHACPHLRIVKIVNCSDTLSDRFPTTFNFGKFKTIHLTSKTIDQIRQGNENNNNA